LTVVLTVGPMTAEGTNVICDTATVTASNENRVNTTDDTKTECTSVLAQADVEIISKTDAPDPVCVQGNITYTIQFRNNGPGPALNATVTDAVPANTTFVSAQIVTASSMGWGIMSQPMPGGTGNVVFANNSVPNGATATFEVVVKVNSGTPGNTIITNTATADTSLIDPQPANDSKQAQTTVDPVPPTITCPANVTGVTNTPGQASGTVNYAMPTAGDNCAVASVVCNPPSGTAFPVGSTTVTCTATDTAGNTATCTFKVTVFDICIQNNADASQVLLINSFTGDYVFCCQASLKVTGKGTVTKQGNTFTLTHNTSDRRVSGRTMPNGAGGYSGNASLQKPVGQTKCSFIDDDHRNNSCNCSAP
jgi:uncharacterized repeat protein (TIGR01451 family)